MSSTVTGWMAPQRFLPDDLLRELLPIGNRRRYGRREILFHEADPADALHVVLRGRLAVRVTTSLGSSVMLDVVGPGDLIGELAVLGETSHRSATVVTLEPAETLVVRGVVFEELRQTHPRLNEFALAVLARRNRQLVARLAEVVSVGAEVRVLRRLVDVARLFETAEETTVVPLTQDDLAGLAATTRETVNRALRRQVAAGSLELGRGRVVVLAPDRLATAAFGSAVIDITQRV
jgi:CRP/FNR family transcriptional regulator, cyclic AMP receptor protein